MIKPHLDQLMEREDLIADIEDIVTAHYGYGNEDLAGELTKSLCDAVCKHWRPNV